MWHFQREVNDWPKAIEGNFPYVIKSIDRGDMLRDAKTTNPNVITVLRHFIGNEYTFGGTWGENLQRARDFFATFIDGTFDAQYAQYVDFVEEWNEYIASSNTALEIDDRLRWAEAAAWVWKNEYRSQPRYAHIRLVLCNVAVGNVFDHRFGAIAVEYDAVLGYHPYTMWVDRERVDWEWDNLSGLFNTLETLWPDWVRPTWLFTECGPFESCECGWRCDGCLKGDRALYVEAVRQWICDVGTTIAYQEGRILGFALFNSGDPNGRWRHFETTYDEMVLLAAMIREEWVPVEPPAPSLPTHVIVTADPYLHARSGPGIVHRKIGRLYHCGHPIEIVGEQGEWYELAVWGHKDWLEPV